MCGRVEEEIMKNSSAIFLHTAMFVLRDREPWHQLLDLTCVGAGYSGKMKHTYTTQANEPFSILFFVLPFLVLVPSCQVQLV